MPPAGTSSSGCGCRVPSLETRTANFKSGTRGKASDQQKKDAILE